MVTVDNTQLDMIVAEIRRNGMMDSKIAQTVKAPEIRMQLDLLEKIVANVHERVGELGQKLVPILSGEKNVTDKSPTINSLTETDLGGQIAQRGNELQDIIILLETIIERLEL